MRRPQCWRATKRPGCSSWNISTRRATRCGRNSCAWYGAPAFDAAFCLNHLLLKCLWTPSARAGFLACFDALAEDYLAGAAWEPRDVLERRTASLLPGLLLARVDGKSPVEYVAGSGPKAKVRAVARRLLLSPPQRLREVRAAWESEIDA